MRYKPSRDWRNSALVKKLIKHRRVFFIYSKSFFWHLLGKRCIHLLHIGKTGGTALKEALRDIQKGKRYRLFLHDHGVRLTDIPRFDDVIIFLRDPVSRFVSGFNSRKREGRPRYYFPHTPAEKEAFTKFPTPNALAEALSSNDPQEREDALKAMKSIGHVRTFYSDWLISIEELLKRKGHLFIGATETLEKDFEALKAWIGVDASNVKLPSDPIKAHRAPEGSDTYLSPLAEKNLRQWYAEDYKFLEIAQHIRKQLFKELGHDP